MPGSVRTRSWRRARRPQLDMGRALHSPVTGGKLGAAEVEVFTAHLEAQRKNPREDDAHPAVARDLRAPPAKPAPRNLRRRHEPAAGGGGDTRRVR